MPHTPDASIIIPVYNMDVFLRQAVDSVLSQEIKKIEIIIIDDASTDHSRNIIEDYESTDDRIRAVYLSENVGPGKSRNIGLGRAKGTYVRFLDPDDYYPPDTLYKLIECAKKHNANIVAGNIYSHNMQSGETYPKDKCSWVSSTGKSHFSENPAFWVPLHHHRFLFNRLFLVNNQISYPDLKRGQDPVMLASALSNAKQVYYINDAVYVHRIFPNRKITNYEKVSDLIKQFTLIIDIYEEEGYDRFSHLHLLNKSNIILNIDFTLYKKEELFLIIKRLEELFKKIRWTALLYRQNPYKVKKIIILIFVFIYIAVELTRNFSYYFRYLLYFYSFLFRVLNKLRKIS